ncbi:putative Bacterial extracellular solute-binding proteins, family [Vibrio nigripulchritudo SOn1]|uniref:Bacterial extracellular solute-binding proteins, family n=1 Tax=Vibrio nigripulchritudo SOn1 TaxID=1238450 RepID=A0AAV2VKJ9_9VIBR|nr:transporter substrate-binding domain-containing protein [Vibrio nigripulchritudo]CCO45081.1 putative Bacterial extracellular solute-binding proteins, family [Vibrio nigripulchritudo SOn1]
MRIRSLIWLLTVLAMANISYSVASEDNQEKVSVCSESWAPFYYQDPEGKSQAPPRIMGINVDILKAISQASGLDFEFELMPHKRCLHNTQKHGNQKKHEITSDVTYSADKEKDFYFVGPAYSLSRAIFYSKNQFPKGVFNPRSAYKITKVKEMRHFTVCESDGRIFNDYYAKHGVPKENIVSSSNASLSSLLMMLDKGRCEIMEVPAAILAGSVAIENLMLQENVHCQQLNEEPVGFYFLVSKASPRAEYLVSTLNQGLIKLKHSGQHQKIIEHYFTLLSNRNGKAITDCL